MRLLAQQLGKSPVPRLVLRPIPWVSFSLGDFGVDKMKCSLLLSNVLVCGSRSRVNPSLRYTPGQIALEGWDE